MSESLVAALNLLRQSARPSAPLRAAVDLVDLAIGEARAHLDEPLWDGDHVWTGLELVQAIERAYLALGGSLDGPGLVEDAEAS